MLTNERIQQIRDRCEGATPGPWTVTLGSGLHFCTWVVKEDSDTGHCTFIADCLPNDDKALAHAEANYVPNMDFIAYARADIPALLADREKLLSEKRKLRDILSRLEQRASESVAAAIKFHGINQPTLTEWTELLGQAQETLGRRPSDGKQSDPGQG